MEVFGVPMHPLVVHAAVVFIPLAALGAIVVTVWRRARDKYTWLAVLVAIMAAGAAIAARITGADLLESLGGGSPAARTHASWGRVLPFPVVVLAITLTGLWWVAHRGRQPRGLWVTLAVLTVLAALVALVMVVITGHLGATAVWG